MFLLPLGVSFEVVSIEMVEGADGLYTEGIGEIKLKLTRDRPKGGFFMEHEKCQKTMKSHESVLLPAWVI